MDFWRAAEVINKRKWLIALSVIVATALTWGATRLVGAKWQSTVQFIQPQSNPFAMVVTDSSGQEQNGQINMDGAKAQAFVYTAVVKSRDVMEPALRSLNLHKLPPHLLQNVQFVASAPRLYQLQVTDANPALSGKLANALAHHFESVYQKLRTDNAASNVHVLQQSLKEADAKLDVARRRYDDYRSQHNIIGSISTTLDMALNRVRDTQLKRDEADQHYADGLARLHRLQLEMTQLPATVTVDSRNVDPNVRQMEDELDVVSRQLAEYKTRYTDAMPVVQTAKAKQAGLIHSLQKAREHGQLNFKQPNPALIALRAEQTMLSQEIAGYQAQAATLSSDLASATTEMDRYKGLDSPLGSLIADVTNLTDNRNSIANRLQAARMSLDATSTQDSIQIMDRVQAFNPPVNITEGRTLKLILLAALCALIATSGLVLGLDTVDRRVRSVKEAEIALPAPVLAAIPQPMGEVTYSTLARATELHPQSLHSEAYRFLGLHLLTSTEKPIRSLMVVSAKAEQGTTTTLTNLGITLAQAGKKVILVDANVRTAELHQVFHIPNEVGFTDLLQSPTSDMLAKAVQDTTIRNLRVVTSGQQPGNPWQLFRSASMVEVARRLHEQADYVLYDTPSAVIFTDALNLAPVVDAAFLCVRALEPVTGAEERIVKLLNQSEVPVIGCVLNDVPAAVVEGYHNYLHYYRPSANNGADHPGNGRAYPAVEGSRNTPWIEMPKEQNDDSDAA